jgi:hypothetical protein
MLPGSGSMNKRLDNKEETIYRRDKVQNGRNIKE